MEPVDCMGEDAVAPGKAYDTYHVSLIQTKTFIYRNILLQVNPTRSERFHMGRKVEDSDSKMCTSIRKR